MPCPSPWGDAGYRLSQTRSVVGILAIGFVPVDLIGRVVHESVSYRAWCSITRQPRVTLRWRRGMPPRGFLAGPVWLKAIAIAAMMTFTSLDTGAQAAETPRKLAVISFGLFGDQGVFRSEATGAAQIVSNRF